MLNTIQVVDADGTGRHVLGTTVEPTGCGDGHPAPGDHCGQVRDVLRHAGRAEGAGEFGRGSAGDHQEFLTMYAPDGTVLGGADLPSLGYGYLVGLDG